MTKLMDLLANSEGSTGLTPFGINEHGEIAGTVSGDGERWPGRGRRGSRAAASIFA